MNNKLLIFFILTTTYFSCNKLKYDVYYSLCVDANENAFKPRENTWNKRAEYSYEYYFDSTCIYQLNEVDQQDWNKLGGFSFDLLTNHKNSFMIGWRYLNGYFELAPYQHLNGARVLHEPVLNEICPNEPFRVYMLIDYDNKIISVTMTNEYQTYHNQFSYPEMSNNSREIFPWFGGNNSSTHYMCIYRKQL